MFATPRAAKRQKRSHDNNNEVGGESEIVTPDSHQLRRGAERQVKNDGEARAVSPAPRRTPTSNGRTRAGNSNAGGGKRAGNSVANGEKTARNSTANGEKRNSRAALVEQDLNVKEKKRTPVSNNRKPRGTPKNESKLELELELEPHSLRSSGRQRRVPKRFEEANGDTSSNDLKRSKGKTDKGFGENNEIEEFETPTRTKKVRKERQNKSGEKRHEKAIIVEQAEEEEGYGSIDELDADGYATAPEDTRFDEDQQLELNDIFVEDILEEEDAMGDITEEVASSERHAQLFDTVEQDVTMIGAEEEDMAFEAVRRVALGRLAGSIPTALVGMDDERLKVSQLLEQTVVAGEGNSMLLIGSRGSGKTALVNSILRRLADEHGQDFHVIRLNGFLQTDDKLALREIWRQLGREMAVDDASLAKNHSDALATLLALLSHPSEQAIADEVTVSQIDRIAKSVVFVMDEFDQFAAHPRQTLLYNLFDIAQSRKAPIAVLGLTARVDAAEMLEKRVKSRFSHRYVFLHSPRSFQSFQEICRRTLQMSISDFSGAAEEENVGESCIGEWNAAIEQLLTSPATTETLQRIYATTKSVPEAFASLYMPIATLPSTSTSPSPNTSTLLRPDNLLHVLPSLSTLALALLIAAARLDVIHGSTSLTGSTSTTVNFNLAYAEYCACFQRTRLSGASSVGSLGGAGVGGTVWSKSVARRAWEELLGVDVLLPVVAASAVAEDGMVRCDVKLEEIEGAVNGLERGLVKWCREI